LIGKAEMTYKVRLTAKANKVYSEADPILKKKIAKCLKLLQETPKNHPQIKALKGEFAVRKREFQALLSSFCTNLCSIKMVMQGF